MRSHDEFIAFVSENADMLYPNKQLIRDHFFDLVIWVCITDLTQTADLLKHRYSSNPSGRKPRNPCDMLRSLLLMHKLQYTSVNKWIGALKTVPLYAILSGFVPNSTPVGEAFYDFFNRLWLSASPDLMKKNKRRIKKPKKKGIKNLKMKPKNANIVEKLVARARRQKNIHYSPKAHDDLRHRCLWKPQPQKGFWKTRNP